MSRCKGAGNLHAGGIATWLQWKALLCCCSLCSGGKISRWRPLSLDCGWRCRDAGLPGVTEHAGALVLPLLPRHHLLCCPSSVFPCVEGERMWTEKPGVEICPELVFGLLFPGALLTSSLETSPLAETPSPAPSAVFPVYTFPSSPSDNLMLTLEGAAWMRPAPGSLLGPPPSSILWLPRHLSCGLSSCNTVLACTSPSPEFVSWDWA